MQPVAALLMYATEQHVHLCLSQRGSSSFAVALCCGMFGAAFQHISHLLAVHGVPVLVAASQQQQHQQQHPQQQRQ